MPGLLTPDPESELLCDIATVWAEPTVLEIHNPPPESLLSPQSGPDPDNRSCLNMVLTIQLKSTLNRKCVFSYIYVTLCIYVAL